MLTSTTDLTITRVDTKERTHKFVFKEKRTSANSPLNAITSIIYQSPSSQILNGEQGTTYE